MKALALTGIRQMALRDVAPPALRQETDVLLKVEVVGLCGSDIHYYASGRIGSQVVEYPFAVGHECACTVAEVGGGVTRVKPGDRVAVDPAMSCWECDQCRMGRPHTCRTLRFLGCPGQAEGCLQEYLVMPQECCYPIPDSMTFDQAALCEPAAIGVYAASRSVPLRGAKVAILGSGPIGLSVLAAVRAEGAKAVYMTEKIEERIAVARDAGADWVGNPDLDDVVAAVAEREPLGLDAVFECAGEQETFDQGLEMLRPGGKFMLIGIPEFDRYSFQADITRRRETCIQQVRRQNKCEAKTIEWIASGAMQLDFMVTHRFPLAEAQKGFDLLDRYADGVIKVMVDVG